MLKATDFLAELMEYPSIYSVLGVKNIDVKNPFDTLYKDDFYKKHPEFAMVALFRNPDYLTFAVKSLMNINLAPFQTAILREIWQRRFPMMIATRGCGKCGDKDTVIMLEDGLTSFGDLITFSAKCNSKIPMNKLVFGENGYRTTSYAWRNPNKHCRFIRSSHGFRFIGSPHHKIRVIKDGQIDWKELQDIELGDYAVIDRTESWFPITNDISKTEAYRMGFFGNPKQFPLELLKAPKDSVASYLSGYFDKNAEIKKAVEVRVYGKLKTYIQFILTRFGIISTMRGNKLSINSDNFAKFKEYIGFRTTKQKELFEQKYSTNPTKSYDLIPIQILEKQLTCLAQQVKCFTKIRTKFLSYQQLDNFLTETISLKDTEEWQYLKNLYDRHYFFDPIKMLGQTKTITFDIHVPEDNTYIGSGFICHNSFLLAVFSMLKCLLVPQTRIVIAGAAFRQSKLVFDYMNNIYSNSPILKDIIGYGPRKGPVLAQDRHMFHIGDSEAIAIPVGDGCLSPYTPITYDNCFGWISDIHPTETESLIKQDRLVWGNQQFNRTDESYCNGLKQTIKLTTKKGFSIEGTPNHKIRVWENLESRWKRFDEITIKDHVILDDTVRWHNGKIEATLDQAYALGAMIGDGTYRDTYKIGFATEDSEIIPYLNNGIGIFKRYQNDKIHYHLCGKQLIREWKKFWNIEQYFHGNKVLPTTILKAQKELMSACLSGLFDTDGHVSVTFDKRGGIGCVVGFTNTSKLLIEQIQYILLHYGICCQKYTRQRNEFHKTVYEIHITGSDIIKFRDEIGFRIKRKQDKLNFAINHQSKQRKHTNIPGAIELMLDIIQDYPSVKVGNIQIKKRKYATTKLIKKFLWLFRNINDIRIRQLESLINLPFTIDKVQKIESGKCLTYDIHVPLTHEYCAGGFFSHNSKIRGLRATDIIAEEFASMRRDIYEEVLSGFAVVSSNPVSAHEEWAKIDILKQLGEWSAEDEANYIPKIGNKSIISGTASFAFNHFYEYWMRYKKIIESGGDKQKLMEIFGEELDPNFDYRDFSIIRIPIEALPKKFMDESIVARARATTDKGIYMAEYGACFPRDTSGFFKRTLIESCVASDLKPIQTVGGQLVWFDPKEVGDPSKRYFMGIDTASEQDNFAIVIIELHSDHRRVVYCWTTNKKEQRKRVAAGQTNQTDFYAFCTRKIRDLMNVFNIERIVIDTQGGGNAIIEALHDKDKMKPGESQLWKVINDDKPTDEDYQEGLHIIYPFNFSRADDVASANYGMRKDMDTKVLLFPRFDPVSIELAIAVDKNIGRDFDTFEDNVLEIEELKNELATIVCTKTSVSGRERWDTPEIKTASNKKGHMKKDRYSALLMANFLAREMFNILPGMQYSVTGNLAGLAKPQQGKLFKSGPQWFLESEYCNNTTPNVNLDGNSKIIS